MILGKTQTRSLSHRPLKLSDTRNHIHNRQEGLIMKAINQGVRVALEALRVGPWNLQQLSSLQCQPCSTGACPTPMCQRSLSWHPSSLQTATHSWRLCKSGKMSGRDTGLPEPLLGVALQDSSPTTRWTLSGGEWHQKNKMLKVIHGYM